MKKLLLLILIKLFFVAGYGQRTTYWQQQVNSTIKVFLNDNTHSLTGDIKMTYQNNSPDSLSFIWIHLWSNAYKNDRTAFSEQQLKNGSTDFYFSNDEQKGYINRLDFTVDGARAVVIDHPQHQDIVKLLLPTPLLPGQSVEIQTPFQVKLPDIFSRAGHHNQAYYITQWFPKPAVYDQKGWHPIPYLDQGEFYSEFGNYDVYITIPDKYTVAATGKMISSSKSDTLKTLFYQQNNIHDFAWFAHPEYEVMHDTLQLAEKVIDVYAYYHKDNKKYWTNSIRFIKQAILTKSEWIGVYPYPVVSVVEQLEGGGGGGMEYPTITLLSASNNEPMLDYLINHEVGHNWFYGILASNERTHPWMDEGMNSYYDQRYFKKYYGVPEPDFLMGTDGFITKRKPASIQQTMLETVIGIKRDQPIETKADQFNATNYNLIAYSKAAQWMGLLEKQLGTQKFDSLMKAYYNAFAFKHPYPEDFQQLVNAHSTQPTDSLFNLLHKKGSLSVAQTKKIKPVSFFSLKDTDKNHYLSVLPAAGFNFYDKVMLGAMLHNYNLPTSKLQFLAIPLFATGSKKLNGLGRVSYQFFPGNKGAQLEFVLAGARFSGDSFTDSSGTINYQPFTKLAPSVKYTFAPTSPLSSVSKYVQFRTFLITETGLSFRRDTINGGDIISYPKQKRYVNQLQFVVDDSRKLYPYKAALQIEQGDGFVRTNITGNYFFNYAKGGGADVRFFAGKFFYTGEETFLTRFKTDRYHLNMTGPKGNEDYNYQNYFVGRNEFDGFSNQQIMMRDGGFKVRTDLLSNKIGKTDNWLVAMNFNTTIPNNINPLSVLPFKLPLKVFADVGTYAEAWESDAGTARFLFDAGLQLSLFKNTLNIYVPLLYSKVYDDYFKSTITEKRFLKNISFSIDIQQLSLKKLFPQLLF